MLTRRLGDQMDSKLLAKARAGVGGDVSRGTRSGDAQGTASLPGNIKARTLGSLSSRIW